MDACVLEKFEDSQTGLKFIACMNFLKFKDKLFPNEKLFKGCEKVLKINA